MATKRKTRKRKPTVKAVAPVIEVPTVTPIDESYITPTDIFQEPVTPDKPFMPKSDPALGALTPKVLGWRKVYQSKLYKKEYEAIVEKYNLEVIEPNTD